MNEDSDIMAAAIKASNAILLEAYKLSKEHPEISKEFPDLDTSKINEVLHANAEALNAWRKSGGVG